MAELETNQAELRGSNDAIQTNVAELQTNQAALRISNDAIQTSLAELRRNVPMIAGIRKKVIAFPNMPKER